MKRYKIIKRQRLVYKSSLEEVEEKIPMWYFKFLLWLFERKEETLDQIWKDTRACAWDKGFSLATDKAHTLKEEIMQRELDKLGYEVKCNFPMARMNPETTECFNPTKAWEIIIKKS